MIRGESRTDILTGAKSLLIIAIITVGAGHSCRSSFTPCQDRLVSMATLSTVNSWQWPDISPNDAMASLPAELHGYETSFMSEPNTCDGIVSLKREDRVVNNTCECCLELQFVRQLQQGVCTARLDQVIFTIRVPTEAAARALVGQSYEILEAPAAAMGHVDSSQLFSQGGTYEWPSQRGIEHIAAIVRKEAEGSGWVVRIEHGRTFLQQ